MTKSLMDIYGYYQIGDRKTYSIYQLMDYYHEHPQPHKWIYNDDFFSQYDWTQEPKESLEELYKNRAKELREQYDYIVLYYSGGFDSSNMLYAFLDNGIYPDEICVFYSGDDTTGHQYRELKDFTWKKLAQIEKQYPQIKIRRFDYGAIICNWPKIIKDTNEYLNLKLDPIYFFGPRMSVNRLALDVMYEYIDDWKKILKDKKTLCTLHGVDSVHLSHQYKGNKFIHNFYDTQSQGHFTPIRQMTNKTNRDILEFFYWAPTDTCAKILIKQGHLAKTFFMGLCNGVITKLYSNREIIRIQKNNPASVVFKVFTYEPFKRLIYPRIFEDGEQFYNVKEESSFWGNRDLYYFNSTLPGSKEHWSMSRSLYDNGKEHRKRFFAWKELELGPAKIKSKGYTI